MMNIKKVYLGFDHGAWEVRQHVQEILEKNNIRFEDCSHDNLDPNDDFPDAVVPAAEKAVQDNTFAIVGCTTGTGSMIAANKVKGMRAAALQDEDLVYLGRLHNDINCLVLRGRTFKSTVKKLTEGSYTRLRDLDSEPVSKGEVKKLVEAFINTEFEGADRLKRRNKKIADYERK